MCGQSLKIIFWIFENYHENTIYQKKIKKKIKQVLKLSNLQLQNFHENSPSFKNFFYMFKTFFKKTCA
jgi:hypothetical protein